MFLDVLDRLVRRLAVEDDQANFHAQRYGEGHAAQHALLDIECRLTQTVADVFQGSIAGIADNRENGLEGRVQTDISELLLGCASLQEFAIESSWMASKYGTSMTSGNLLKSLRIRFFSVYE